MMNWKEFFDSLGMNGTQWQWRIMNWKKRWAGRKAQTRQKISYVKYQHKFCDQCQALMDSKATLCHHCGAKAPSYKMQVLKRSLNIMNPSLNVSTTLIGMNLLNVFFFILLFGPGTFFSPNNISLIRMGALVPYFFFEGEYWRLITYGYLHIGIIHLAFNLIVIYQVGPTLERLIGGFRFFTIYTLSLIAGGAADLILRGHQPLIVAGASGALFGLIGFGMSFAHFYGGPSGIRQRNFFLQWALYAFIFGFIVRADNIAHAGGFVIGALMGFLIERERRFKDYFDPVWKTTAIVCLLITIFSFIWMIINRGGAVVLDQM